MLTKDDLKQIDLLLASRIRQEIKPLKKDIKRIKTDIIHIRKSAKVVVTFFDREYLELRKRIERMEAKLRLPPLI